MKKILSFIIITAGIIAAFNGCTTNVSQDKFSDYSLVEIENDKLTYSNLSQVEEHTDVIVIGTFEKETTQELFYASIAEINKDVVYHAVSENSIKVAKVLKGDVKVGESLVVMQEYGTLKDTKELRTVSELTPMEKGDTWLFFLFEDDEGGKYWCTGDNSGRFPVKNVVNARCGLSSVSDKGVYKSESFRFDIYNEILKKYELE
ncbi:MAG: hypothetical protein IKT78_04525 [Ruminiclostridium sp.]|nr:hypothetical protein [Ruminiclostridium sp.]